MLFSPQLTIVELHLDTLIATPLDTTGTCSYHLPHFRANLTTLILKIFCKITVSRGEEITDSWLPTRLKRTRLAEHEITIHGSEF